MFKRCESHLDDVVGGVFVVGRDVQADQDTLAVLVPHLRQRPEEAPLLRRPLVLPARHVAQNWPSKLGLSQRLQHRLGVHLLQDGCQSSGVFLCAVFFVVFLHPFLLSVGLTLVHAGQVEHLCFPYCLQFVRKHWRFKQF